METSEIFTWYVLNESFEDMTTKGLPKAGDIVSIDYLTTPANPISIKRKDKRSEQQTQFSVQEKGMDFYYVP